MIRRLIVLGGTGDLAGRYLLPALARLQELGELPEDFSLVGVSREPLDDVAYRQQMGDTLSRHAENIPRSARRALLESASYACADVGDPKQMAAIVRADREPVLTYLALPPAVYQSAIRSLIEAAPAEGSRLVVEKPFGTDLESAVALNRLLASHFQEDAVFRIDHFLGMQTVQNLLGLRFANRIFESLWNADHVAAVQIIWDETLTLEGRAGYYDATGALVDMLQNHLLQLLCLTAMEAPHSLEERDLRDRKLDVLRAVRRLTPEAIERTSLRGRYGAGRIGDHDIPAYRNEEGVDAQRGTETFAQLTLHVDNWRWAGVPFLLRSGKALARDRFEIAVHFRPVPHLAFEATRAAPNVLCIELEPERVALHINLTAPGERLQVRESVLDNALCEAQLPPYSRLLLDALNGDSTLAIRGDEAEEAWRIIEPVMSAWAAGRVPLHEYAAGSEGPAEASGSGR